MRRGSHHGTGRGAYAGVRWSDFPGPGKWPAYVGLIPAEYSTGGRKRLGHISKQGNVFLRWVLVEAATVATRYNPEMKRMLLEAGRAQRQDHR